MESVFYSTEGRALAVGVALLFISFVVWLDGKLD